MQHVSPLHLVGGGRRGGGGDLQGNIQAPGNTWKGVGVDGHSLRVMCYVRRGGSWGLGFGFLGLVCGFEIWCGVWGVVGVGLMIRVSGIRVGPDNPPSPAKATAGIQ